MSDWVELEEAWSHLEGEIRPLGHEEVRLAQACGRVLARAVRTDRDFPPFDRAAMDGFAVRSADVVSAGADAPVALNVVGESTPGKAWSGPADSGSAVRIMTGAPVPQGWDAVVPVESTSGFDTQPVQVFSNVRAGQNVAPRGVERHAHETVLESGHLLRDVDAGILAMVGASRVTVFARPRVAVLSTGDELVSFDQTPGPTQIRNSNAPMLAALARSQAHVEVLGAVRDARDATVTAVERGMAYDFLLLTGGVSMGAYDWVGRALDAAGVRVHFRRVALQPGKPVLFGTHAQGVVLALPGNPVSAYTTFRLFARPALQLLQGMQHVRPTWLRAAARFEWTRRAPKCVLLPGRLCEDGGAVERVPYSGSGDLMAYARADCQIVLPRAVANVRVGQPVAVWPLDGWSGARTADPV